MINTIQNVSSNQHVNNDQHGHLPQHSSFFQHGHYSQRRNDFQNSITSLTQPPARAKWAFTTRRVNRADAAGLSTNFDEAISGDLVMAQVISVGSHKKIQLAEGRTSLYYENDIIIVTCGDRYAPDQFEGVAEIGGDGADLLAGGGVIGRVRKAHQRMLDPTRLLPLGLITNNEGETLNIADYGLPLATSTPDIPVLVVVGNSMNAGKTTAAVSLAHGLQNSGKRVAGIKATGTGAFGDFNAFLDAGIANVSDFTDAGMATTYRQPLARITDGLQSLLGHAASLGAELAVVEIADGIFQQETADLLRSRALSQHLSGVMFAAPDALSAVAGVRFLENLGITPFAVSGKVSCSPLACEEFQSQSQIPVITREGLCQADTATDLVKPLFDLRVAA